MNSAYTSGERPGRPWAPLLVEAFVGAGVGVLLAIGGGYLGPMLVNNDPEGFRALGASVVGVVVGFVAGAPLGVVIGGRLLRARGVAWRAFVGSVIGAGLGALIAGLLRLNQDADLLRWTFAGLTLLGAIIGYQRFRPAPDVANR